MKDSKTKHTIYIRIFSALFATYLVLMIGFSMFLISQERKEAGLELRMYAAQMNNIIEGILQDNIDNENQIINIGKVRKELMRESFAFTYLGIETALFSGDYNLIFNTNDYWRCSYTEYREGSKNYTGYGYLNPKEWFNEEEIKELENYLYAAPKAKKEGDLAGYSLSMEVFWVDNEMIIPDKIIVTPMYASSFDENGNVNSSGGIHSNNIVYTSGYKNTNNLPYFEHGAILTDNRGYGNNEIQTELRNIIIDKEKLKEAVKKVETLQSERVNLLTYRYYLLQPYQNTINQKDSQNYYSAFWTVLARDINLLDKSATTLAFMWFSCFIAFTIVALILSKQTYKTYKNQEELEKQRRETTNALAHDLKTPLSIVSGYAQNLMENVHTEKREHYARNIETNVKRMDKIIQEMLELSRLESGSFQIVYEDVSLHKVCAKIIERYDKISKEKHIKLSLEGDATIIADNSLIERVIDNFFVNALNNTPDDGTICIKIFNNTLEFYNSGSHIPEEKLKEIWLPYKKLDVSRSSKKGTGLGLSISRTILELFKFQYGAKNCNDGVVFWFKFA